MRTACLLAILFAICIAGDAALLRMRWSGENWPDFLKEVVSKKQPVVIENPISEQWMARMVSWNPSYFLAKMPNIGVAAKVSNSSRFSWGCCKSEPMPLESFFSRVKESDSPTSSGEHLLYNGPLSAFDLLFDDIDASLLDVAEVPADKYPDLPVQARTLLSMGSDKATVPLRYDAAHNVFVQVQGATEFALFSPDDWHGLYLHPKFHMKHKISQLNLKTAASEDRFRYFRSVKRTDFTLYPGYMLYLPPVWFYETTSLVDSISFRVWSPSEMIETLDSMWEEDIPLNSEWKPEGLLAMTAEYLHTIFHASMSMTNRRKLVVLQDLIHSRYQPLFDSQTGSGPYRFLGQTASFIADASGTASALGDDLSLRRLAIATDVIDPQSQEGQAFAQRIQELSGRPRPFVDVDELAKPAELRTPVEDKPPIQLTFEQAASNALSLNYQRNKDVYKRYCGGDVFANGGNAEVRGLFQRSAQSMLIRLLNAGASPGVEQIYLFNWMEDLAAQIVGEDEVWAFFNYCVMGPKGLAL